MSVRGMNPTATIIESLRDVSDDKVLRSTPNVSRELPRML
jgi:hypothetical protein